MKTKPKWYSILLVSLVILLTLSVVACGKSSERQEIVDFINNSNTLAVMARATAVSDDWNTLVATVQTYDRSKLIYELGLLEQRASISYKDLGEVVPPKSLRSFWDKEVEASKLYFQAISLMYRTKDDPNISLDQINDYVFRANDLKTEALRELEGICEKQNIKLPW